MPIAPLNQTKDSLHPDCASMNWKAEPKKNYSFMGHQHGIPHRIQLNFLFRLNRTLIGSYSAGTSSKKASSVTARGSWIKLSPRYKGRVNDR